MGYYISKADGSRIPFAESGELNFVETITAAKTLKVEDSGKTFILDAAAGAEITLPALASGLNYRFIVGSAFATTNWTIVSSTSVIQGNVLVAGAHVAGSDENTISFVATAESIGDYVNLTSDGTNFYVSGSGVSSGAITLTSV
ncbi:hypothetical protein [uncultured Winogradskyella sp.]|uniref:hypothetical protein n=1 Tax=uncultured Winogradskyella sp. TaxID=395353 RepID=UPI00262B5CFF|nr:hypothetical protein [uncultured Winogradskyella sp.]